MLHSHGRDTGFHYLGPIHIMTVVDLCRAMDEPEEVFMKILAFEREVFPALAEKAKKLAEQESK